MTLNVADISLFKKPDGFHAIWKTVTILSLLLAEHIKIIIFFILTFCITTILVLYKEKVMKCCPFMYTLVILTPVLRIWLPRF